MYLKFSEILSKLEFGGCLYLTIISIVKHNCKECSNKNC
ncbi:unnamed protein product [Brugia timori]|uniref:Uncharacterized protein n=1 Tax=Brugia timori TaxID=42155 RepID=A0A0R3R509_9BILA|nr:unnamed protein product [Brugia timori]